MLCREGHVEANDSFQRQFSPSCNFQNVVWKFVDSARSLVRMIFFLKYWCLCVLRTLRLSLSLTCTVVGGRRFRSSVAVVDGRRYRPTSGHLQSTSMFIVLVQQQIRTIGRRAESVVGCKPVFPVLMDAAVLTCTCLRPSVVVKYNQLYSEMRNVRACFYDVTTRMLCFVLQDK